MQDKILAAILCFFSGIAFAQSDCSPEYFSSKYKPSDLPTDLPNYRLPKDQIIRKTFTVNFAKNSAVLTGSNDEELKQFLNHKPQQLKKISIHGYSSVEGELVNNSALHQKRAQVIQAMIQKKLGLSADKFQIQAKENWSLFFEQLAERKEHNKSKKYWKERLQSKKEQENFEELLSKQRKTEVTFYIREPVSREDVLSRLENDRSAIHATVSVAIGYYYIWSAQNIAQLKRYLAMRSYVRENLNDSLFHLNHLRKFDDILFNEEYHIYTFYDDLQYFESQSEYKDYMSRKALVAFDKALEGFKERPKSKTLQADLVEILRLIYLKTQSGYFDPEVFASIKIPDNKRYCTLQKQFQSYSDELFN
ncbi:hypothetical protein E1176_09675 [Fulvivirga sp. RKSG066]|uniref:OmpA family protein n=1 Tax=Fulvivirga aurantia TaxID=2529383 RepID=UPI0012BC49BE|nr:OmpA family protein [Fulvivirga aurantia]MTI21289.1 hypothetical protein [Fulvivirga aurantia]